MPRRLTVWLIVASGLAACGDWPWRHEMVNQPSQAIASSTRAPSGEAMTIAAELPMSRELAETRLQSPVRPDAPVDAGHALFHTYCSPCHGETANGAGTVSQYFGSIPDLTSADVQQHGDGWLYETITNGTERMPRYEFELTPNERWQIVHFLRAAGAAQ